MSLVPEINQDSIHKDVEAQSYVQNQNRDDSILNESRSGIEEIRQKRKYINFVLRTLNQNRNKTFEGLFKECVEVLKQCGKDILTIVDEDRNNCNSLFSKHKFLLLVLYFFSCSYLC
jgi:hypothetical protein